MSYAKPFLTYSEQIDLLKKRNLIILDDVFAKQALSTLSYYDLINRYKKNFFNETDKEFAKGVTIEYLYSFFLFDRDIQSFILKYSVLAESIFKTKLAYTISERFGVDVSSYLNPENFQNYSTTSKISFSNMQSKINEEIKPDRIKNPSKHYLDKHNHIPPWILLKNLSLGNTIKLFTLLNLPEKIMVANEIIKNDIISHSEKIDIIYRSLSAIKEFRNYAAHNLDFTALRINSTRSPAPKILFKLLGNPLISRVNKKITANEKNSLKGIYGVIMAIMVIFEDDYLRSVFLKEYILIHNASSELEALERNNLYDEYTAITDMPKDIILRFNRYIKFLALKNNNYME